MSCVEYTTVNCIKDAVIILRAILIFFFCIFYFVVGNTYSGEFHQGELHGQGVMKYKDGSVYEGEWAFNKRSGIKTIYLCHNYYLKNKSFLYNLW